VKKIEALRKAGGKITSKAGEKALDFLVDALENIDILDQLADMVKGIVPCKMEISVKKKKSLEVNILGVKEGKLWITVQRFKEKKPVEPEEVEEATEEETEE